MGARTVGLLVFDRVDLLDVGGPYEVLLTADRLAARRGEPPPFDVRVVAVEAGTYTAYGGMRLAVDTTLAAAAPLDVLVVPGLIDVGAATADRALVGAVRAAAAETAVVTSVCTGAFLLEAAGVLGDVVATTHEEDLDALGALLGEDRVRPARWVDAGDVVTAGGLSSGIAMALHLVDRLHSRELATATATQLAYAWDPDDGIHAHADG